MDELRFHRLGAVRAQAPLVAGGVRRIWRVRSAQELADLVVVGGWWLAAEVGVRVVSLPRLAPVFRLQLARRASAVGDVAVTTTDLDARERRQLDLVGRVASHWPGDPGPCLRQALVTGRLLSRRHRPRLCLGLLPAAVPGGREVVAHAWVELPGGRCFGAIDGALPFSD